MNFEVVDAQRGSNITYSIRRWARNTRPYISIVHLAFAGTYRDGSGGAPDAHYMLGIKAIIKGSWYPSAIILDLSSLVYEWGDEMELLIPPDGDKNAVVVGDKCSRALATLRWGVSTKQSITELSNFFDNFDSARNYVARRQVDEWNEYVQKRNFPDKYEILSLADLEIGG